MMKQGKDVKIIDATVVGDVTLHDCVNVWYGSVIRGDSDTIEIGENTNVQDLSVIHTDHGHKVKVGKNVTIGHRAIVHGCTVEDEVMIGMGAIVMNGAVVGKHSIIGAGALVPEGKIIPPNSVAIGCPAKIIHQTSSEQIEEIRENAKHYVELAKESL